MMTPSLLTDILTKKKQIVFLLLLRNLFLFHFKNVAVIL